VIGFRIYLYGWTAPFLSKAMGTYQKAMGTYFNLSATCKCVYKQLYTKYNIINLTSSLTRGPWWSWIAHLSTDDTLMTGMHCHLKELTLIFDPKINRHNLLDKRSQKDLDAHHQMNSSTFLLVCNMSPTILDIRTNYRGNKVFYYLTYWPSFDPSWP